MIDALRFVKGAVAKKDFNPILTHYLIKNGRVTGCNGRMTISSPIDLDIEAAPKADALVKAVDMCEEALSIHLTEANRLAIRSGKFKAYIDCHMEIDSFPEVNPKGERFPLGCSIIPCLKELHPFLGVDASREWCNTYLFTPDGCVTATNNICMIQKFIGRAFPEPLALSWDIAAELIRIGQEPESFSLTDNDITFYYPGERWMQSVRRVAYWTEDYSSILNRQYSYTPVPPNLFASLRKISKFVEEHQLIYFDGKGCRTVKEEESGASIEFDGAPDKGTYNASQLLLWEGLADRIDFSAYPAPIGLAGNNMRGVMVGAADV